jgi:hypothetical protein
MSNLPEHRRDSDTSSPGERDASGRAAPLSIDARTRTSVDHALAYVCEMHTAYVDGAGALHDLDEAVEHLALTGRASGALPEQLIVGLKHACSPLLILPRHQSEEFEQLQGRLVSRLIEVYFGEARG